MACIYALNAGNTGTCFLVAAFLSS